MTEIHFVDVGQGNMVLVKTDDGSRLVFDCNITLANEARVLSYVERVFGKGKSIKAFICSHRDADHIRGIKKLHAKNPISTIWDSGYPGTTTDSEEYKEYMALRAKVGATVVKRMTREDCGKTRLRFLSAADDRLPKNANAQGIVIKVEQLSQGGSTVMSSAMLPGDSDAETWKDGILKDYETNDAKSSILMAAHHGSNTFFEIPNQTAFFTAHLQAIAPEMVIISVGPNTHGHPKKEAMAYYERYALGASNGSKVARTDKNGNIKLELKIEGGWEMSYNQ